MTAPSRTITATLQAEPGQGGWTYVVMTDSAEYSGTRGLARIRGRTGARRAAARSFAFGEGTHKPAVRTSARAQTGKQASDAVTVHLEEHIPPTPPRSAP
jgi:hypothetical protein